MAHKIKDISHINEPDEVNNIKLFTWLIGILVFFIIFSIAVGIFFYTEVLHDKSNNPNIKILKEVTQALEEVR